MNYRQEQVDHLCNNLQKKVIDLKNSSFEGHDEGLSIIKGRGNEFSIAEDNEFQSILGFSSNVKNTQVIISNKIKKELSDQMDVSNPYLKNETKNQPFVPKTFVKTNDDVFRIEEAIQNERKNQITNQYGQVIVSVQNTGGSQQNRQSPNLMKEKSGENMSSQALDPIEEEMKLLLQKEIETESNIGQLAFNNAPISSQIPLKQYMTNLEQGKMFEKKTDNVNSNNQFLVNNYVENKVPFQENIKNILKTETTPFSKIEKFKPEVDQPIKKIKHEINTENDAFLYPSVVNIEPSAFAVNLNDYNPSFIKPVETENREPSQSVINQRASRIKKSTLQYSNIQVDLLDESVLEYFIDENGFLIDQTGKFLLDEKGQKVLLTEDNLNYLKSKDLFEDENNE